MELQKCEAVLTKDFLLLFPIRSKQSLYSQILKILFSNLSCGIHLCMRDFFYNQCRNLSTVAIHNNVVRASSNCAVLARFN